MRCTSHELCQVRGQLRQIKQLEYFELIKILKEAKHFADKVKQSRTMKRAALLIE